jgi:isocitrate dehydrogenase (NAD+)
MSFHSIVLIPGDGIGPEVSDSVIKILRAADAPVEFVTHYAGLAAIERNMDGVLPAETIQAISETHVALKGPCTTPVGKGFSSVNVALRRELNLYAALRPIQSVPGVKTRYENVDIVIVRENTEGLYSGIENQITPGVVVSMKVATRVACQRISHWTFRYANARRRKKVSVFHKANIMKMSDGLLLEEARKVHARDYPNIQYQELIIDAACMRLVQDPSQIDVILCENLYGDIVSDLCAGLIDAVFEAVHGSAPDIAGRDLANPMSLLMSAAMMLDYLADNRSDPRCEKAAEAVRHAYNAALADGQKTRDLGGELGTSAFTQAVIDRLRG